MKYKLNNGLDANFMGEDDWGRLIFNVTTSKGNTYKFCIVDGKNHTLEGDIEEPGFPLKEGYQFPASTFKSLQIKYKNSCSF